MNLSIEILLQFNKSSRFLRKRCAPDVFEWTNAPVRYIYPYQSRSDWHTVDLACYFPAFPKFFHAFRFNSFLKQDFKEISKDDYFAKNNEFATWLKEEKGKYFSDLSSESARDIFLKFVKQWNKGKLPSQYYAGITTGPRSAHNWNIKKAWEGSSFLWHAVWVVCIVRFLDETAIPNTSTSSLIF